MFIVPDDSLVQSDRISLKCFQGKRPSHRYKLVKHDYFSPEFRFLYIGLEVYLPMFKAASLQVYNLIKYGTTGCISRKIITIIDV